MDLEKMTTVIVSVAQKKSIGFCTRNIREAIEKSGGIIEDPLRAAKDYGETLKGLGYIELIGITIEDYKPLNGDIIIWNKNNASKYGHIQVYVSKNMTWYSDFAQHSIYPNDKYYKLWVKGGYSIYRYANRN